MMDKLLKVAVITWAVFLALLAGMLLTTQAAESLPARGAWIEIPKIGGMCKMKKSLPARGAWIEITTGTMTARETTVAPRTGSMD